MGTKGELVVDGKRVPVSNLDKVLYPATGFTKAQVIDYYIRIAPVLLPHLRDRPISLKRYPDGVEGGFFYEKRCPPYRPKWVDTTAVWSKGKQANIDFCVLNDLPSLVWAANLANLELHTFLARRKNLSCPTMLMFDLDPGPPANIVQCCQVGLWLREILEKSKLKSFPKTSGSKGLQVAVPLNTAVTYDQTKHFAKALAERLEKEHPELVVSKMTKTLRTGKVFVDWSQNDDHKTTICVYSLRGKENPTVSTPLDWSELEDAFRRKRADRLVFLSDPALKRVKAKGDLFKPVLELRQRLPRFAA